jgi:hypothetical protein
VRIRFENIRYISNLPRVFVVYEKVKLTYKPCLLKSHNRDGILPEYAYSLHTFATFSLLTSLSLKTKTEVAFKIRIQVISGAFA